MPQVREGNGDCAGGGADAFQGNWMDTKGEYQMTWNPIKAGGKFPKNGEKVLVTDGKIWESAYFYKGPVDTPYFHTLEFETNEIKAWARVEMGKK
jgi:hypothetical protein